MISFSQVCVRLEQLQGQLVVNSYFQIYWASSQNLDTGTVNPIVLLG